MSSINYADYINMLNSPRTTYSLVQNVKIAPINRVKPSLNDVRVIAFHVVGTLRTMQFQFEEAYKAQVTANGTQKLAQELITTFLNVYAERCYESDHFADTACQIDCLVSATLENTSDDFYSVYDFVFIKLVSMKFIEDESCWAMKYSMFD